MAETLREFLIEVGFKVDDTSLKSTLGKADTVQKEMTAKADEAGQQRVDRETFRQALIAKGNDLTKVKLVEQEKRASTAIEKVNKDSADRLARADVEMRKKASERRTTTFKDASKEVQQFEAMAVKVAGAIGTVAAGFAGSSLFQGIMGAAGNYAAAAQQSLRTGASVTGIQGLLYGLSQLGVSNDEANSSFEGFRSALVRNPGLKALLKGQGVNVDQTPDKIFAELGRYFSAFPKNVALQRAGDLGVSENTMLALENPALAGKVAEGVAKPGVFGLDPDKAAADGKATTAAYNRLAADLEVVKDKVEAQFFKPMTAGFNEISDWLEKHPDAANKFAEGMTAFAGLMAVNVVPKLAKLALTLTGLTGALTSLPAWVIALLGADAALHPLNAGEGDIRSDGIHMPDGSIRPNAVFDPNAADGRLSGGPTVDLPRDESSWTRKWRQRPKWMGGEGKGGARERLGHVDDLPDGPAPGANGFGLIDAPYRAPVDRKGEGGYLSPREMYNYLKSQGASDNEALLLTGAAGSESSFNPNAIHDGGRGHGLFGHNDHRLDMRGRSWQQQASAALTELRQRAEHALVESAKTDDDLATAEMHYEDPRGYTRRNPRGGDNYTGRLGTIRRFRQQLQGGSPIAYFGADSTGRPVPVDAQGRALGSDGKPTKIASPYGSLTPDMFKNMTKTAPLGPSAASMYAAYDNSRTSGDSTFNQTVNVNGVQNPSEIASQIKLSARRGGQDYIRLMQGASQ